MQPRLQASASPLPQFHHICAATPQEEQREQEPETTRGVGVDALSLPVRWQLSLALTSASSSGSKASFGCLIGTTRTFSRSATRPTAATTAPASAPTLGSGSVPSPSVSFLLLPARRSIVLNRPASLEPPDCEATLGRLLPRPRAPCLPLGAAPLLSVAACPCDPSARVANFARRPGCRRSRRPFQARPISSGSSNSRKSVT